MHSIKGNVEEELFKQFKIICLHEHLNFPDGFKHAVDAWVNLKK